MSHRWDNWVCQVGPWTYRYCLQAKGSYSLFERHDHASIGVYRSRNGIDWEDRGVGLDREGREDHRTIWTGSVLEDQGEFLLFYTACSKARPLFQRMYLARGPSPERFGRQVPILDPDACRHQAVELGYDLGDNDGYLMAWRDPFVFRPEHGPPQLWFAAKARKGEKTVATVGRAERCGTDWSDWRLLPPLSLAFPGAQVEVPNVIRWEGTYYLTLSLAWHFGSRRRLRCETWRSDCLEGPWEKGGEFADRDRSPWLYGANLAILPSGLHAFGFLETDSDTTPTALLPLTLPRYPSLRAFSPWMEHPKP